MARLKSLADHDAEKLAQLTAGALGRPPTGNGIACPACGEELQDSEPQVTLTSNPPTKAIHCPACGYHGFRLA